MSSPVLAVIAIVVGIAVGVGGVLAVSASISAPPAPVNQTSYNYGAN